MQLKHKLANRPSWNRIVQKDFRCVRVEEDYFTGYVTALDIIKVKKPLSVVMHHKKILVADDGFTWYMLFPDKLHYSLTVMVNPQHQIVQCYFDIVEENVLDEHGVPGFDDLFLDVVFTENDSILLDEDELSEALLKGMISPDKADMAYFEALDILNKVEGHYDELCQWINLCIKDVKKV